MRILEIREAAVSVASSMRNAVFSFADMTTSVVAVITDRVAGGKPVIGYAFNSTGRYACGAQMRARFIPRLLAAPPESLLDASSGLIDPAKALACMERGEKPGGHADRSIAIGTIETAIWDAVAKAADEPLPVTLARRYVRAAPPANVACYVGGGWYRDGERDQDIIDEVKRHLDSGYTHLKIKVGGIALADDLRRVERALSQLPGGAYLAVDANGKFARDDALAYARGLEPFGLRWFEEPCDPHDLALHAEIAQQYQPALGTGENLYSRQDVINMARFGGLRVGKDYMQIDPPQCYGIHTTETTVRALEAMGWDREHIYPHGGNQMSLAVVAGLGLGGCEAYPGVFGAFGGYADHAKVEKGRLSLRHEPGIGFEAHSKLIALMRKELGTA